MIDPDREQLKRDCADALEALAGTSAKSTSSPARVLGSSCALVRQGRAWTRFRVHGDRIARRLHWSCVGCARTGAGGLGATLPWCAERPGGSLPPELARIDRPAEALIEVRLVTFADAIRCRPLSA